jgi:hypothetical protein
VVGAMLYTCFDSVDEAAVREQLEQVRVALARNEEEHEALVTIVKGFEAWLRLNTRPAVTLPLPVVAAKIENAKPPLARHAVKGKLSVRQAVLQVLKDARGEPLHAKEIARRVSEMGAVTSSKNPAGVVGLVANSLQTRDSQPIEKVAGQTWRWAATGDQ